MNQIVIVDSKNLAKLGIMHLLAVNIWTWLRFVIAKNAALERIPLLMKDSLVNADINISDDIIEV